MSDSGDLKKVEDFVTNVISKLKAEVLPLEADLRIGFFAKGIDFITMKISDGGVNVELVISGTQASAPISALPVRPDRLVQPMYVELPSTPNTGIKSINLEVDVLYVNGQSEKKLIMGVPVGMTTINI